MRQNLKIKKKKILQNVHSLVMWNVSHVRRDISILETSLNATSAMSFAAERLVSYIGLVDRPVEEGYAATGVTEKGGTLILMTQMHSLLGRLIDCLAILSPSLPENRANVLLSGESVSQSVSVSVSESVSQSVFQSVSYSVSESVSIGPALGQEAWVRTGFSQSVSRHGDWTYVVAKLVKHSAVMMHSARL